jgi:NAD(P)-dependent dehydrogenase (short-subunit alcohol dehydrogenase family)
VKLEGKTAIVTGAGRGLGRAIALAMSREGARTAIMSRSVEELEETARQMEGETLVFTGDVSKPEDVSRMIGETRERFSGMDILVNNAGIIGPVRFLEDTDDRSWRRTLGVNLNGAFYFAKAVIPVMRKQGWGKIINIVSGLGRMPFPRFCAYSVSKAGLIQLTLSLSDELRDLGIRVNAIDPGVMDTKMQQELRDMGPEVFGESIFREFVEYKERGELKDPAEVARLVVFLACSESEHLTGRVGTLSDYKRLGWPG